MTPVTIGNKKKPGNWFIPKPEITTKYFQHIQQRRLNSISSPTQFLFGFNRATFGWH